MNLSQTQSRIFFTMICAIAIGVWTAGGALAQGEADPPSDEPVIETKQDKPSDERIASRLQGIYKEIDSLNSLEVFVSEGVLTVRGEVASEDQAESALRLAKRIEGVVTVEDEIERSLDIEGNLTPKIQKYRADLEKFIRGLPLLGLALAVFLVIALFGHWFAKWRGVGVDRRPESDRREGTDRDGARRCRCPRPSDRFRDPRHDGELHLVDHAQRAPAVPGK